MTKTMFNSLFCLSFFLGILSIHSQSSEEFNNKLELEKIVKVPRTPEVDAFSKYGDLSSSLSQGTPNVVVPLYSS